MDYFLLSTREGRKKAIEKINSCPDDYVCTIEPRKRTVEQNRLYWAILKEIEEQHSIDGVKYRAAAWHEVLKQALLPVTIEKAPDNKEVKIYKSTAKLNKEEFSNLLNDLQSFCRDENIQIDHLLDQMPYAK